NVTGVQTCALPISVSTPTHRFGRRCSAPSTHDSTTAGGRYATSSTPTRNGEISGTPPLDQSRPVRGGVGVPMWTGVRRGRRGLQRGLHPDDAPPHPDLPASADVQARAGVLPAPVLRLLRQFRTHLPDGGAARHGEDLELVVLRAPAPLDGEITPPARIADVLDTGDESGAGSDQPVLLCSMTCGGTRAEP